MKKIIVFFLFIVQIYAYAIEFDDMSLVDTGVASPFTYMTDEYFGTIDGGIYSTKDGVVKIISNKNIIINSINGLMAIGYDQSNEYSKSNYFICNIENCSDERKKLENSYYLNDSSLILHRSTQKFLSGKGNVVAVSRNVEGSNIYTLSVYTLFGEFLYEKEIVGGYFEMTNGKGVYWNAISGISSEINFKFVSSNVNEYKVNFNEWDSELGIITEHEILNYHGIDINKVYPGGLVPVGFKYLENEVNTYMMVLGVLNNEIIESIIWGKVKYENGKATFISQEYKDEIKIPFHARYNGLTSSFHGDEKFTYQTIEIDFSENILSDLVINSDDLGRYFYQYVYNITDHGRLLLKEERGNYILVEKNRYQCPSAF